MNNKPDNKLKRTDFFENFKLSTTLNEIFVVWFTIGEKHSTQSLMLWSTCLDLSIENRA